MIYGQYPKHEEPEPDDRHERETQRLQDWRLKQMLDLIPVGELTMENIQNFIDISQSPRDMVVYALELLRAGVPANNVPDLVL